MTRSDAGLTATIWIAAFIFIGYMLWGYAMFLDGEYVRKISQFWKPHSVTGTDVEVPACEITHRTLKNKYRLGEEVWAEVNMTKWRNLEGLVQWNLMDARFYPYAARRGVIPIGHHHLIVLIEAIPKHVPLGTYYFKGLAKYETNPIKNIYIPIKTNDFEVVK
jgi:hypothetical protein